MPIKQMRLFLLLVFVAVSAVQAQSTFTNPLKETGPDPWVIKTAGIIT